MNITLDTWIISDTHFGHKNIVKYCSRPMNHENIMIKNWNGVVWPEDAVLHLGDLMVWYGDTEDMQEQIKTLNGKKSLIKGNQDKAKESFFQKLGFQLVDPITQKIGARKIHFTHYPMTDL